MAFTDEFKRAKEAVLKTKTRAVRRTLIHTFQAIVNESPVDTGRFRGNWQLTFDRPAIGTVERMDKGGGAVIAEVAQMIQSYETPLEMEAWFVNNLPYAANLEYGSSQQAPQGMVRVNIAKVPTVLANYLRREAQGGG